MSDQQVTGTEEEFAAAAHRLVLDWKEYRVKGGDDGDLPGTVVDAYRGSQHVASLFPPGRDAMLYAAKLAVGGLGADRVSASMDTYIYASTESEGAAQLNPDTGRPFEPGDMMRAFQAGRSWVSEALVTCTIDRVSRRILFCETPYRITRSPVTGRPRLRTGPTRANAEEMAGLIPDALREAVNAPDAMAELRRDSELADFLLGRDEPGKMRAHLDAATLVMLAQNNVGSAYRATDPDMRGIVERAMERAGLSTFDVDLEGN